MKAEHGTVVRRTKGFYYIWTHNEEEIECKIKGQLFKKSTFDNQVAVGDKVKFIRGHAGEVGLITSLNQRRSFLSRNRVGKEAEQVIAANIDHLLIVAAAKNPPFRTNLVNRMLVAAAVGNIKPILVIAKTDLVNNEYLNAIAEPYKKNELETIFFTNQSNDINSRLLNSLTGNVSVLAGQSGVGKSTILNVLFPSLDLKVGEVSAKTGKGSHTTTYAVMHRIAENSFVIDTPGIREFGLWNISKLNLGEFYPSFKDHINQCKHRDCCHISEPGCAVKEAVKSGVIHSSLYKGYVSIYETLPSK